VRAVVVESPGGPESLVVREVADPAPNAREVIVDVAYCGCNWADIQVRQGTYPHPTVYPKVPGIEVSGTVRSVGAEIQDVVIGQRVVGLLMGGGYGEQVAVPREDLIMLPDGIPLDVAAAFPAQAMTAYYLLHVLHSVKPGDYVLCHAVGGGVGLYVTQLAHRVGARVIGTVGTKGKELLALEYGAHVVVNTADEDFTEVVLRETEGRGVQLAIDSLGATTLDRTFGVVEKLGHVINIGEAEGQPIENIRERVLPRSLTFTRIHMGHVDRTTADWLECVEYVCDAVAQGWLRVPIVDRFPLEKAAEMHRTLEGRSVAGKLLLGS
jgi:NADPH:quinone reductase